MSEPYRPAHSATRRFRLDPEAARAVVTRVALGRFGVALVVIAIVVTPLQLVGEHAWPGFIWAIVGALLLVSLVASVGAARRASASSDVELLLSDRVLYRSGEGRVAEILRPEVTEIVRMSFGLLVLSATPNRSLFVSRAFDGFSDVCEALGAWKPMREMRGMAALGYATRAASREGPRDAVMGTALATDASLVAELDSVRAASLAARANSAPAPIKRRGWPVGLLWVGGVIVFLGIWQILQPSERKVLRDCKATCRYSGACVRVGDRCVADSDEQCAASIGCVDSGHCKAVAGRCVAGTDADCGRSENCSVTGKCKAVAGACVVSTDADCKASTGCRERGLCTAAAGMCVAGSDDECRRSGECTRNGTCRAAAGACVAN